MNTLSFRVRFSDLIEKSQYILSHHIRLTIVGILTCFWAGMATLNCWLKILISCDYYISQVKNKTLQFHDYSLLWMWCHVVWLIATNIREEFVASIVRQKSIQSLLWESQILWNILSVTNQMLYVTHSLKMINSTCYRNKSASVSDEDNYVII
jgi:hypothetical protein